VATGTAGNAAMNPCPLGWYGDTADDAAAEFFIEGHPFVMMIIIMKIKFTAIAALVPWQKRVLGGSTSRHSFADFCAVA
jgi:hypothetical protein